MNKLVKWILITLGSLLGLVLIGVVIVYFGTESRLTHTYTITPESFPLYSDSATITQGRQLGVAIAKCVDCHGDNLGGKIVFDGEIGTLAAPNITTGEGSVVKNFTDADWVRAIHHGVAPDGRGLVMMPSEEYAALSREELNAIVSWVKSMPPVNNMPPPISLSLLGRVLFALKALPPLAAEVIDHSAPIKPAPEPGVTLEYGRHLAATGGCIGCHGPNLSGGAVPGGPPDWPEAGNLTPDKATGIGNWTEQDFFKAMRDGLKPGGQKIDTAMPVRYTRMMTDVDIRALFLYLKQVPARPKGGR